MVRELLRWSVLSWAVTSAACGGAVSSSAVAAPGVGPSPAKQVTAPTVSAAEAGEPELVGQWVRYWSLSGHAVSPRYVFLADGRYVFTEGAERGQPVRVQHTGHYSVASGELLLEPQPDETASANHEAQRLALGACPPNEEAQAMDKGYACISVGGEVYFRCSAHAAPREDSIHAAGLAQDTSP